MSEKERPTLHEAVAGVRAFLDVRGPDRGNVIATAGAPHASRYNKWRLRVDHLQRILDEIELAQKKELHELLLQGIKEAHEGRTKNLGDFTQYLDEE